VSPKKPNFLGKLGSYQSGFLHPDIEYSAFYVGEKQDQIFVATQRAARNMAYQGMSPQEGHICFVDGLQKIKGTELLGCALRAPLTSYATIYALPMLTIKDGKGGPWVHIQLFLLFVLKMRPYF